MKHWQWVIVVTLALATGCRRDRIVGSLACEKASDCSPPAYLCGPDGRCIPGCGLNPNSCIGGSVCEPTTGECTGAAGIGRPCSSDEMCDPPDLVCQQSTMTCVAGCTLGGSATCPAAFVCNASTGHCCDPTDPSCPPPIDAGNLCNSDPECIGAPANICSGGLCIPGCTNGGACMAPLMCNATTGHCETMSCARDLDCDNGSYCTQSGHCSVLAFGGPSSCAGGTVVYYSCAQKTTPAEFSSCVGPPGPAGCPYCIEYSCFHGGLCTSDAECHRGDACVGGLCRVKAPECPTLVPVSAVVGGTYAAGKEVCVRDTVTSVENGYDGFIEIKLGTSPYLFIEVPPMYKAAGVVIPSTGQTVTAHGTVRWDDAHDDRELLPVDWIGP
jgi:hypothetical protein